MPGSRRLRLTREGFFYTVVLLAVLIGATSRQLNLLMLIGCVLTGPLLFSLVYGRWALGRVEAHRQLPSHLHAEERLRVDLQIVNRRRWPGLWALRVDDAIEHEDARAAARDTVGVFFGYVPRQAARVSPYEGTLPRRGRYFFGPLRISTRFPMGLLYHSIVAGRREELLVHPRLGRLNPGWLKQIREHESGTQRMTRRGLLEADFYGLREWRPGDSRRWIHWRTSARRGGIIVRQFEQRRSQNLAILIDLWQPANPSEADRERVETAVSFAATLLAESCRKPGAQLHVEVAAREPLQESGAGSPVFLREQMDALALVMPHDDPEFPRQLGHALALIPASTPTLLVTTRPVDWAALSRGASERETQVDGRSIVEINVGDEDLARFYQQLPAGESLAESGGYRL